VSIRITTKSEQEAMRQGGAMLSKTLETVCAHAKAGISTWKLDKLAEKTIRDLGGEPGFKGYQGFPGTLCIAVNEIIVHGIPSKTEILKEGDLLTIDCGVKYKGMNTDAARSIGIGKISEEKQKLIEASKLALKKGIEAAKPGNYVGDISKAIAKVIDKYGFYVIHNLTGHGVGKHLHQDPIIINYWDGKKGAKLKAGMTLAIEPIFSVGSHEMLTLKDGWSIATDDGSCAVQYENTILITEKGNEILTQKKEEKSLAL